jgi:hypothetical protein
MSKRTASQISQDVAVPAILPTPRAHYIEQTLLGPICTHPDCQTKVAKRGGLFDITSQTLLNHWKANNCYHGPRPNASDLVRRLNIQLVGIHERVSHEEPSADALIARDLPPDTTTTFSAGYCLRCGFSDKPSRVRRHASHRKTVCTILDFNERGTIYRSKYGFAVPKAVLERIVEGTFVLPAQASRSPAPSRRSATTSSATSDNAETDVPEVFVASELEMSNALSTSSAAVAVA